MATRRPFLPALRQAFTSTETKQISLRGFSTTPAQSRSGVMGLRDSAAGWDLDTVVQDGYERVVWVFKAVEVIAGNASRLPFIVTGQDDSVVLDHPLVRVMNKRANPLEISRAFRKRLSAQVLLSKKGAFVEVTKNRGGQITRLDLLPPDRVEIVADPGGDYVDYFEFTRYDGDIRRLTPERVRWIREPHPLDPFSGVTPLEAAGMSVELDRLARTYNVSFINNDGRPGGILGVDTDGLDEEELERINARLQPGAYHAGKITAIGTGSGGIDYVDTSSKPRDMAYETTSEKAKKEILAAFGVPVSLAGDASEKSFQNSDKEEYNFWQDPMLPHLDLIASAFDEDVDPDLDCGYDTSKVEALELPARRRREEHRQEFDKGLRSVDEYRRATPDLEPLENPQSRALWISPAKAPIAFQPGDEAALGLGDQAMGDLGGAAPPAGEPVPQTATDVVAQAVAEGAQTVGEVEETVAGAVGAVAEARGGGLQELISGDAAAALGDARMEGKALRVTEDPSPASPNEYAPDEDESRRVELAVGAALDALLARQAGVIAARIESPKTRKNTRYWTPDADDDTRTGEEPIDTARVVDTARWAAETQETLQPIAGPAATESANGLLNAMVATGALVVAGGGAVVVGRAVTPSPEQVAMAAAQAAVAPVMLALATAEAAMRDWLDERISDMDRLMTRDRLPLPEFVAAVKQLWEDKGRVFADSLAVTVAQTVVGGGRDSVADALVAGGGGVVERVWQTRDDEQVRAAHQEAAGQVRPVGDMFDVGGFQLRYPSDPLGPPSVTRWCRCHLLYRWPSDARFAVPGS